LTINLNFVLVESFIILNFFERAAFELEAGEKERLLLTAAVPANKNTIENGYDVPRLSQSLDLAFVMAYDLGSQIYSKIFHVRNTLHVPHNLIILFLT